MTIVSAALLLLMACASAAADDQPSAPPTASSSRRFEAWVGGSFVEPSLDTKYETRYSPSFGPGGPGVVDSTAGQSLTVHGSRAMGGEAGVGWSPDGRWFVRVSAARSAGDLAGANTPYSWSARITTSQPPSNLPQTFEVEQEIDWPDTEGRLRVSTLALGVARRWQGRRFCGGLSAGGALVRASGEVGRVGFTAFHLGGHSTFFTQEFEVEATLDPATVAGFHAGADLDVVLGTSWRLRLDYRYLGAADVSFAPRVTRIVNEDEILLDEPLSRIQSELGLDPLRLDLSSSRLLLSVVFVR